MNLSQCVRERKCDDDGENVVLFTQLALSLEIGFSNTKFDRIGIEMRNKNIKLRAALACMHIRDMNLSHYYHTYYVYLIQCHRQSKCLSNKVSECMRVCCKTFNDVLKVCSVV